MSCSIVALRDEDVVVGQVRLWPVKRSRRTHESLLNVTKELESMVEFCVPVVLVLKDLRNNGNVVALGADAVRRRHHSNVGICFA